MQTQYSDYKTEIEKKGVIAFVPGGNSMWPTLKHRKQSVVVEKKVESLKPFDVAFYMRPNGTFVLHRVIEKIDGGYVICGDSQLTLEKVKEESVFGKMIGFYRGKRYIEVTDPAYVREVENFYRRKKLRRFRLKCFHFGQRVKNKLKRIFKRKSKDV